MCKKTNTSGLTALLLLLGICLVITSGCLLMRNREILEKYPCPTTAMIVALGSDEKSVIMQYEVNGQTFVGEQHVNLYPNIFRVGDAVSISYNDSNPAEFHMDGLSIPSTFCIAILIILMIAEISLLLTHAILLVSKLRGDL